MSNRRGPLVAESQDGLEKFKDKTANELGIDVPTASKVGLWSRVPAERCGEVGGAMVKRMIESYEKNLIK